MTELSPLFSVATFRDWVIIFMGIATAAFFFVAMIVMLVIGLLVRALLKRTVDLMDDSVKPLLDTTKQTVDGVKGTTSYMADAAVTPIIRTYGVVAGVRRAAGVLAGLTGSGGAKPRE